MDGRNKSVVIWLLVVFGLIGAMVAIGGVTRLTGSGLSMVKWHPLMGALPPLSHAEWQHTFGLYQQSPQYQLVNQWMALADFQRIFMWEYLHRLLGRFIGLAFFVPWLFFVVKKRIPQGYGLRIVIAFFLGGAQGLLGWFMVKSGLVDRPEVSHFRLAAHLCLAFAVAQWVWWLALDLSVKKAERPRPMDWVQRLALAFMGLLTVQIVWGAFMAGKKAGHLYATFPDLNGHFIPPGLWELMPWWKNLLENPANIHVTHRFLGWAVLLLGLAFWVLLRKQAMSALARTLVHGVLLATSLQFVLGVLTVVFHVPVSVAVVHQVGAFCLLSLLVAFIHQVRWGELD